MADEPSDTPIVSVNHHSETLLVPLLGDLGAAFPHRIVVDNSGTYPQQEGVTVLRPGRNLGFGSACNLGIGETTASQVLLLNPDVKVDAAQLRALSAGLHRQRHPGIVAPVIRRDQRWITDGYHYPGLAREMLAATGMSRALNQLRAPRPPAPSGDLRRVPASSFPSGALWAVDVSSFRAVGGFDEDYFLYVEDADLVERLRSVGSEIAVDPAVVVDHLGAQGSSSTPTTREVLRRVGVQLFAATHYASGWEWFRRLHLPMVRALAANDSPIGSFLLDQWQRNHPPREVSATLAEELRSGRLSTT
jgi:N-acetylglucosaminyl-diphospho-decaprenol L-rhamnosyltransferase